MYTERGKKVNMTFPCDTFAHAHRLLYYIATRPIWNNDRVPVECLPMRHCVIKSNFIVIYYRSRQRKAQKDVDLYLPVFSGAFLKIAWLLFV